MCSRADKDFVAVFKLYVNGPNLPEMGGVQLRILLVLHKAPYIFLAFCVLSDCYYFCACVCACLFFEFTVKNLKYGTSFRIIMIM